MRAVYVRVCVALAVAVLLCANVALADLAVSGTYVLPVPDDMTGGNTARLDGLPTATNPWYQIGVNPATPGLWAYRDPYSAWAENPNAKGFQDTWANAAGAPELVQTVTGLNASRKYDVSIVYHNYVGGASARLHGAADYVNYGGLDGTLLQFQWAVDHGSSGAVDGSNQAVIGTVSGVTSYQVDIRSAYALSNSMGVIQADRYIGTAYVDIGAAPEPGTLVLLVTGLLGLLAYAWRKRK